jgi:hypothetical protein
MALLHKQISVNDATHTMAKGIASALGITVPEVMFMAVGAFDKANGLHGHTSLIAEAKVIRAKMKAKAGRRDASRSAARGRGPGGARYDHSKWNFAGLVVGGPGLSIPAGLEHGARIAAGRYREAHEGWGFTMWKQPDGTTLLTRTA